MSKFDNFTTGTKTFFHDAWSRFVRWYKKSFWRKVFLFALILAIICFIVARFDPTSIAAFIALALGTLCIIASIIDSWKGYRAFNAAISQLEYIHAVRTAENLEQNPEFVPTECFVDEDMKKIKKKKQDFKISILLRLALIIILVVIFIAVL